MNNHVNDPAHQQWYGANQNLDQNYGSGHQNDHQQSNPNYQQPPGPRRPPPSHGWAPYPTVPLPARATRRRRRCDMLYSVVRHVSPIAPFIMIIITAYIYIRDASLKDADHISADHPAWLPLYVVIPVSVANVVWSFVVMITQRRAAHRGRPISQKMALAVELILAIGGAVCFALLVAYIDRNFPDRPSRSYYFPLSYEAAIAWLLGVQMLANALLAARAGYEMKVQRRQEDQHEAYIVH